jgi:hypothetical protein
MICQLKFNGINLREERVRFIKCHKQVDATSKAKSAVAEAYQAKPSMNFFGLSKSSVDFANLLMPYNI